MAFEYQTGGDLSTGGSWLSEEGTYHLIITGVDDQPTKKDGSLIDNAAFRADLSVLDGTSKSQKEKVTDILFFLPKPSDKGDGAFAKKKMDRFFLAAGLVTKQDVEEKDKRLSIDLQSATGRQIVAKFSEEESSSGKKRIGLSFSDIYHVDDPAVKDIPKDADSLALLEPSSRWVGNKPPASPPKRGTQPAAASSGDVDYSDL